MKRALALLLAVIALRVPAASADEALDARHFDARGRAHYASREFDAALTAFLRAHQIAPSHATLYNVALTAQLAREDELAWSFFEAYLRDAPAAAPHREEAARRQREVQPRVAVLALTSDPPGAEVFVDRRDRGAVGTAPMRVAVSPGAHRLFVEAPRHAATEIHVTAALGRVEAAHVTLTPRVGAAAFGALPEGAQLELVRDDGWVSRPRRAPTSPSELTVSLVVGRYEARLVAEDQVAPSVVFEVREGETRDVGFVVRARQEATGRLVVRSTPAATLSIDGAPRAQTPVVLVDLPAGRHRLTLSAPGFVPWEREVEVRARRSTPVDVALARTR